MKWHKDTYSLSDELADVDVAAVHHLLSSTYWASSRPRERTERALTHSICFSLKQGTEQVGFARVIIDDGCYAIIVDVVIHIRFQRQGLGRWLLSKICSHPKLQDSVVILWTTDQVEFYKACGLTHEEKFEVLRLVPLWMNRGAGH